MKISNLIQKKVVKKPREAVTCIIVFFVFHNFLVMQIWRRTNDGYLINKSLKTSTINGAKYRLLSMLRGL